MIQFRLESLPPTHFHPFPPVPTRSHPFPPVSTRFQEEKMGGNISIRFRAGHKALNKVPPDEINKQLVKKKIFKKEKEKKEKENKTKKKRNGLVKMRTRCRRLGQPEAIHQTNHLQGVIFTISLQV